MSRTTIAPSEQPMTAVVERPGPRPAASARTQPLPCSRRPTTKARQPGRAAWKSLARSAGLFCQVVGVLAAALAVAFLAGDGLPIVVRTFGILSLILVALGRVLRGEW